MSRFEIVCSMLATLPDKIPKHQKSNDNKYSIEELIAEGTEGTYINSDELKEIVNYIDTNAEIEVHGHKKITTGVLDLNDSELSEADFAEVKITTADRIINLYCNVKNPKTRKVCSLITVELTTEQKKEDLSTTLINNWRTRK